MPPDDDTADALAALRGLDAQRAADDEAERTAVPAAAAEQAALAIVILEERRPWHVNDRRALGLPRTADGGDWQEMVARRLGELDDAAVIEGWLHLEETGASPRGPAVRARVSTALARHGDVASFRDRLDRVLRGPSSAARDVLAEAAAAGSAVAPVLIQLLRAILTDLDVPRTVAEAAVRIAGAYARHEPAAAALIAARARLDRPRRLSDAEANVPIEQWNTVSSATLADAARASGAPALVATALLELERPYEREAWARALLAIAPETALTYLARMRGRPGWSALVGAPPVPPADPVEGLTSPLADVRRASLEVLAVTPHPAHLQALLLGAELDRFAARRIYRTSWRALTPTRWIPLLRAHATSHRPMDGAVDALVADRASSERTLLEQLAVLRADQLLEQLLDTGAARSTMPAPQELTPALRELAVQGVEAFAARVVVPPLSDEERAALGAEERELAAATT